MILQALCQLADQERLIGDPDFEFRPVSWAIALQTNGEFAAILDQRRNINEGTKRKPKWEGKAILVPRQPIRTSGACAFFLVDKSEYVLGIDPTGKREPASLDIRTRLFREQVAECYEQTKEAAVGAVLKFLEGLKDYVPQLQAHCEQYQWAPNDQFAFRVALDENFVHNLPLVRKYWKSQRGEAHPQDEARFTCLVSGERFSEAGLFPLIKRVPGGTSSGVALVSYNAASFESYGLKGNENAPVSRESAEKAATALNRLLHVSYPDPLTPNQFLKSRHCRLSIDTSACFWAASAQPVAQDWLDNLPSIFNADTEDTVSNAYQSIWYGKEVKIQDPSAFYVLVISGAQGRAVVRDWIETTLDATSHSLALHFADLKIVRNATKKEGLLSPAIPLRMLLESLAAEGKSENIPPSLETGVFRAAITGQPYPFQLLQRALLRQRAESGRDEWLDRARKDARAAILKAVMNRRRRFDSQAFTRYPEIAEDMNPSLESSGYSLGMLLAVLERLQAAALGNVNASLVDRFFSAASATPRTVFVRLLRNARHHARKALDSDEGGSSALARRLEKLIDALADRFQLKAKVYPPKADGIPLHLDLEQQALFVLGYHQMRHWLWLNNEDRTAWEQRYPDAPSAFCWVKKKQTASEEEPVTTG